MEKPWVFYNYNDWIRLKDCNIPDLDTGLTGLSIFLSLVNVSESWLVSTETDHPS